VKYIGAYVAAMNGVDEIVFTAGIGENSAEIRRRVCESLGYLNIGLDSERNNANEEIISDDGSEVKVKVIKTNEELVMAEEAIKVLS
jgi:acetate kinase